MGDYKFIKLKKVGDGIIILTLNRPEVLNALNNDVLLELECALYEIENDAEIKVIIITGAGDKAFVAGADISLMKNFSPIDSEKFAQTGQRVFSQLENSAKISIAAINGYALGGGLELAMACDIIVADANAKMGQPEINLGIIPGFGGTQRLARIVGVKKACELILTGKRITAKEAKEIGLVNVVAEKGKVLEEAMGIAKEINSKSAVALKKAKESIMKGINLPLSSGLEIEKLNFSTLFATHDAKEGLSAFIEKRKPKFKNE